MMAEHNTSLDDLGKQYLPEGYRLDHDRGFTAQKVTTDVDQWKKSTNKMDLKGFDTRKLRESSKRKLLHTQGVGYVEQEPDRFMRSGQVSRKLIEKQKDKILDYESFKEVLKDAWGEDPSLSKFFTKHDSFRESDYEALFNTPVIQEWLENNIKNLAIPLLQKQLNIERDRAEYVFNHLTAKKKGQVLSAILRKGAKVHRIRMGKVKRQGVKVRMASGKTYYRRKAQKWTNIQVRYLINNHHLSTKEIVDYYNKIFTNKRSYSSISTKIRRLKR